MPRSLQELEKLRNVSYSEVKALRNHLVDHSPFENKHGVKRAEFENVLVVVGRSWNQYNFDTMLTLAAKKDIPPSKQAAFERNLSLFYVACSRPRTRLAILFTQKLSEASINTINNRFGAESVRTAP